MEESTPIQELIEDVIFWEKHTEIYTSLEETLQRKYMVSFLNEAEELQKHKVTRLNPIREVIEEFMNLQMEQADDLRQAEPLLINRFNVQKING